MAQNKLAPQGPGAEPGSGPYRWPILRAVAIPPHLLWVPLGLWKVILGSAFGIAVLPGMFDGSGEVRPELTIAVMVVLWPICAYAYRRDPHVTSVWTIRLKGQPVPAARGTVNVARPVRRAGRIRFNP
ncbi:MAG: hypothetical protein IBJ15_08635 [Alphaproteobacteria bacterium]|nr:hypothetical protein [Alphaproteobacteria bacterium]